MRWLVFAVTLLPALALARPPDGQASDPAISEWYHSLRAPNDIVLCCDQADCRNTAIRQQGDHWQAFISKQLWSGGPDDWVTVPDDVVIHGKDNPTGEAVVCFWGREIRCFVPASGV